MAGGGRRDCFAEGAGDDGDVGAVRKGIVVDIRRPGVVCCGVGACVERICADGRFSAVCPAVAVAISVSKCGIRLAAKDCAAKRENSADGESEDNDGYQRSWSFRRPAGL